MKMLLCTPLPLSKEIGTPKILVELAEELRKLGWLCDLQGPIELDPEILEYPQTSEQYRKIYAQKLRDYLREHSSEYDVVDYDRLYLPYPRTEFSPGTLMVARSALLIHHLEYKIIPIENTLKGYVGNLLKGNARHAELLRMIRQSTETIRQADLVNVSTEDDRQELIRRGIPGKKIVAIPYGISQERQDLFNQACPITLPKSPKITFIGTFDLRKGSNEMPKMVQAMLQAIPDATFQILGAANYPTDDALLTKFPPSIRDRIEIMRSYKAEELPMLLADCSIGIFPSYLEGFPFGMLEMLSAAIPVIAYRAPGAAAMLPDQWLVARGDAFGMSHQVISLLQKPQALQEAKMLARQRSEPFLWRTIAATTNSIYRQLLVADAPIATV